VGIYNFESGELSLTTKGDICFALQLRPRVTVVKGDSATGKTLLWRTIETIKRTEKDMSEGKVASDVELINRFTDESKIEDLLTSDGKLIIIDHADMMFKELHRLAESVVDSTGNHFLIFSRDTADLGITPNHYGEFCVVGKMISVEYPFSVKGWM